MSGKDHHGGIECDVDVAAYLANLDKHGIHQDVDYLIYSLPTEKAESLLDVGYGSGLLLKKVRSVRKHMVLTGIEVSQAMYSHTRKFMQKNDIEVINADLLACKLKRKYEIIVMSFYLHHTLCPKQHLKCAKTLLMPFGALYIMDRIAITAHDKESFPLYWNDYYAQKHEWWEECPNILTRDEYRDLFTSLDMSVVLMEVVPHDNRQGADGFPKTLCVAKKMAK